MYAQRVYKPYKAQNTRKTAHEAREKPVGLLWGRERSLDFFVGEGVFQNPRRNFD